MINSYVNDNWECPMNQYQIESYFYIHIRNMIKSKFKRPNNLYRLTQ